MTSTPSISRALMRAWPPFSSIVVSMGGLPFDSVRKLRRPPGWEVVGRTRGERGRALGDPYEQGQGRHRRQSTPRRAALSASRSSRASQAAPTSAIQATRVGEGGGGDPVALLPAGALRRDEPGVLEDAQVLGHRLPGDVDLARQLGGGGRARARPPPAARPGGSGRRARRRRDRGRAPRVRRSRARATGRARSAPGPAGGRPTGHSAIWQRPPAGQHRPLLDGDPGALVRLVEGEHDLRQLAVLLRTR